MPVWIGQEVQALSRRGPGWIARPTSRADSTRQRSTFDLAGTEARLADLRDRASAPDLWDDQAAARKVTGRLARAEADVKLFSELAQRIEDAATLLELAREEDDDASRAEAESELDAIGVELDALELRSLLGSEFDESDAIVSIHPGAGGTDSADWADMLLRMYLRWCERAGFTAELDDYQEGDEAGLKSATVTVRGPYAYGKLVGEKGVHRLVRISPFDSNARRHTAFAAVDVIPVVEDDVDVEIRDEDLKIDTYRSSGAGGQHVNVTDSAVRITHLPTNIVVSCQNERSQIQNRAKAMDILRARLAAHARQEREAELAEIRGEQKDVAFGSQIRSYVLHPYQQVKDVRTGFETGNIDAVLDGAIDPLIESVLRWKRSSATP